ncbi:hypothetical protein Tco_1212365 [Tanacetum coccineum]
METHKPLLKDADGEDINEHMYRLMIGSLMYLTSSISDIMFAVYVCARFQVNPKVSHLHVVKRIFSYLRDRKSTTGGCQFLGCRLISWQCKKQTVVANSTTKAEYIAASNCYGQVLWIQNQFLYYRYNFMQTKIHIDNESTICIVKNPVFHSKTKHIEIRHHFIRDSTKKKLIQMIKIHTDKNVADLLTKAFDVRIGVHAGDLKLMLLGINLLLLEKVNAARHNLLLLVLQALVDGKKIVVTEASVRRDLQLEDANGVDCLPNATIFEQLTLMGYEKLSQKLTFYKAFFSPQWKFLIHTILQCLSAKTTAWNEFSSTMPSVIICLANNQKFNFSKYIFESMMKNLDSAVKFLMYLIFVQVFLDNQLEGMINHNIIYITPSHTKKVFANMKRQGKDFSGRVTPLFSTMMVQDQQEQGEGSDMPTITQPSSSQPQKKHKPRKPKKKDTQISQSNVPSDNLADEAVNEESALEIDSLKRRVKKLEKKQRSRTHGLRRLYKVGLSASVVSSKDEGLGEEDASKQGRKIHDIDADEDITLENVHDEDMFDTCVFNDEEVFARQDMAEKEVSTTDPVTTAGEVVTTANVEVSTASPTAATITTVELTLAQTLAELKSAKPKTTRVVMQEQEERIAREKEEDNAALIAQWNDIQDKKRRKHFAAKRAEERRNRPPTKAQQRSIMLGDGETKEESSSKRTGEELESDKSKKRKLDEKVEAEVDDAKEAEELKQCLEIVPDDVTIDACNISYLSQNRRDLPRDIPLDSVVVLRYDKRSKSENKGKVPTETELVLEQTQQGTSYEVSVSVEGVEELKREVKIKGEKKEALFTLKVTRSQEGQRSQDDDKRLCLVDDLKKFKITFMSSQRYKSTPKVKDDYNISEVND